MKKNQLVTILLIFGFLLMPKACFSQDYKDYLDPVWDNYYNSNPSGIDSNYKGSDFIKVVEYVNFIPKRTEIRGDANMLKRVLLSLDFSSLRQMRITGDFYARSKKHDDYYYLYNSYYSKIDKTIWDRYAPYLIPLMEIDGIINLK